MNIRKMHNEISIVIQGPIMDQITHKLCDDIYRNMPECEIIVSTWKGYSGKKPRCDIFVENDDPGEIKSRFLESGDQIKSNNINRQIVSTREGLKKAHRKYVMKIRSDAILENMRWESYLTTYYGIDDKRVACFEPRNPEGNFSGMFCVCDFWFFGKKEQLLDIWDIPFDKGIGPFDKENNSLIPEQYIYEKWFEKKYNKRPDYCNYIKTLKDSFIILPYRKCGIISSKHKRMNTIVNLYLSHNRISHYFWRKLQGEKRCAITIMCFLAHINGGIWTRIKQRKDVVTG